ncbi:helix-turn-helix domain-containing protein [Vogesella indigofera]|uniref:helix-turn-helix domain-containing protein n=1 Tax=Vogesella indigofera TaxID=45465 RepID=UPI00234EF6F5|nr:helix-turn-helix domain-containing protein [Vogesella indigofera]MDC7699557.1 helix-turn-helix domain-containing protein [Vogesella indigofera]
MSETLDISGAARLLNVSDETMRELAAAGQVLGCKIGMAWVFVKDDLMDYLRQEARRQTAERLAKAKGELEAGARVKTAVAQAGSRVRSRRKGLPDLTGLESAAA